MNKIKKLEERLEKVEKRLAYYDFKDKNTKGWELTINHEPVGMCFTKNIINLSYIENGKLNEIEIDRIATPLFDSLFLRGVSIETKNGFFKIDLGDNGKGYYFVNKSNGLVSIISRKMFDDEQKKKGKK